jgi:hypothetical protein
MAEKKFHIIRGPDRLELMRGLTADKSYDGSFVSLTVIEDKQERTYHFWVMGMNDLSGQGNKITVLGKALRYDYIPMGYGKTPESLFRDGVEATIAYHMERCAGELKLFMPD